MSKNCPSLLSKDAHVFILLGAFAFAVILTGLMSMHIVRTYTAEHQLKAYTLLRGTPFAEIVSSKALTEKNGSVKTTLYIPPSNEVKTSLVITP